MTTTRACSITLRGCVCHPGLRLRCAVTFFIATYNLSMGGGQCAEESSQEKPNTSKSQRANKTCKERRGVTSAAAGAGPAPWRWSAEWVLQTMALQPLDSDSDSVSTFQCEPARPIAIIEDEPTDICTAVLRATQTTSAGARTPGLRVLAFLPPVFRGPLATHSAALSQAPTARPARRAR